MATLRLDKLISVAQKISRADAKKQITKGMVTVNGAVVRDSAQKADPESDVVRVSGQAVQYHQHVYILQNKPLGIVSSTEDSDGKTVLDILPEKLVRKGLFPAGRLDKYSEGMMIITDDGVFAHKMLSPKSHVPKTYFVTVNAPIVNEQLAQEFAKGVFLGDGEHSSPAILQVLSPTTANVTIFEGIYHEVRRMFDRHGGKVTQLRRFKIGGLLLDEALPQGQSRLLRPEEIEAIFAPQATAKD